MATSLNNIPNGASSFHDHSKSNFNTMNGSLNSHGRGLGSVASKMTASASSAASTLNMKMNMNMTTTTTNGHSNISGTGGGSGSVGTPGRLGNGVNSGINKNMSMNMNGIGKNYTSAPTSTSTSLPSTATSSASVSSSAASKAKTVSYEQFAPKSSELRSKLSKIQNLTCGPIADAVKSKAKSDKEGLGGVSGSGSGSGNGSDDFFLQAMAPKGGRSHSHSSSSKNTTIDGENSNSCENTPQAQIKKTLALTQKTSAHITQILNTTNNLHATLTRTTNFATTITNRHSSLLQHSSELSHAAERLQSESDQLAHHAKEIGLPLKHYDAVDRLGLVVGVLFKNGMVVKGIARVKVDQDDFKSVLVDVDDAVNFFAERSESVSANQSQVQAQDNINNASADANNRSSSRSQPDENSAASGSVEYYKRALALQEACMDLFKESIAHRIQQTSTQVMSALDLKRKSVSGDTLEASMIYTRYHGISSRSQLLLSMIKKRKEEKCVLVPSTSAMSAYKRKSSANVGGKGDMVCPYSELWNVCRNTYIQSRLSLLKLSVRNHLDFLKEKHGLIGMTRLASVFLMRLCTTETAMYLDFFGNVENEMEAKAQTEAEAQTAVKSDEASNGNGRANGKESGSITTSREAKVAQSNTNGYGAEKAGKKKKDAATLASQVMAKDGTYYDSEFQAFLDELCNNLHRTIRRGIVSIMELDTLCQIVSVLREERSLANASPTTMAAARSLGRVIFDAQERLIFCANGALSKEVVRFKAVPADLDYPDKLRKCKEQRDEKKEAGAENDPLLLQMQIYESWFPPIRSVLKVLSKIFRVVEPKVFEDIALSSVQACSRSLKEGSSYVEKKSGQLHSDLFLVKHLLVSDILFTVPKLLSQPKRSFSNLKKLLFLQILREQLSPFDIQLRSVERQLDFSDAGKAVSRFLANRNRRLFSMSTENALVTLLREGVHTREASIDSKRDLEDALRSACNDFIEHTAVSLAGPIITFVEQCKSIIATDVTLASQSFMTGDYLTAVVTRTLDRLEPQLGEVSTQMALYMDNTATQSILMKPVIKKIVRVLEDSKKYVLECAVEGNTAWTDEAKDGVLKCIGEIEIMIKTASPRK